MQLSTQSPIRAKDVTYSYRWGGRVGSTLAFGSKDLWFKSWLGWEKAFQNSEEKYHFENSSVKKEMVIIIINNNNNNYYYY